jgi:cytochrome o ubiquinol oxidase subunit 2
MRRAKLLVGIVAIIAGLLAIYYVMQHEKAVLTHPKGIMAHSEWRVIATNYLLMFLIVIPTFIALFVIAWKYRADNPKAKRNLSDRSAAVFKQLWLWLLPMPIVGVMIFYTWKVAHELDPYRPLVSEVRPLTIQVVALDWKWLFIYPEQGIATVNLVHFPEKTPINLKLAADGSPMNSFWIPQLSGQIYAMTGMITPLHIMANGPGEYAGRAAEINGSGYSGMTFLAKSTSQEDFEKWVADVKGSSLKLTQDVYDELTKASEDHPVTLYSQVEEKLFNKIVMKYMHH